MTDVKHNDLVLLVAYWRKFNIDLLKYASQEGIGGVIKIKYSSDNEDDLHEVQPWAFSSYHGFYIDACFTAEGEAIHVSITPSL